MWTREELKMRGKAAMKRNYGSCVVVALMMDGEKWDTFVLEISFIGWQILSLFTIGILGVAYVSPYLEATRAELYAYCKEKGYQQGFIQ